MAKKTIKRMVEEEVEIDQNDGREYVAIVSGQGMQRRADGRIDTVDYREAFILTDLSAPLSHIVSFYLKPRLIKKHGRSITGLYTHLLETVFPKDDPESIEGLPIRLMSFAQLATYCKAKGLKGFSAENFSDVIEARETVEAHLESEAAYHQLLKFYTDRTIKLSAHTEVLERSDEVADEVLAAYDAKRATPRTTRPAAKTVTAASGTPAEMV